MKKILLAIAMVFGVLLITNSPQASADETKEICVEGTPGFWQNFEPNNSQEPFQGPPEWPSDPRGTWSDPKTNGGPQPNTAGVFQNGQGNGSWFYRDLGTDPVECPDETTTTSTTEPPQVCVDFVEMEDNCNAPETTAPTTTEVTTTTVVPTIPPAYTLPDVCYQHIIDGPTLEAGDYILVESLEDATGTTNIGALLCAPVPTPDVVTPTLPSTGSGTWVGVAIASWALALGGFAMWLSRRGI